MSICRQLRTSSARAHRGGRCDTQSFRIRGEIIPSDKPDTLAMGVCLPCGILVGMAPWNAPVILGVRCFAMPVACGKPLPWARHQGPQDEHFPRAWLPAGAARSGGGHRAQPGTLSAGSLNLFDEHDRPILRNYLWASGHFAIVARTGTAVIRPGRASRSRLLARSPEAPAGMRGEFVVGRRGQVAAAIERGLKA